MILSKLENTPEKKIPVAMALIVVGLSMSAIGINWSRFAPSVPHVGTDWSDSFVAQSSASLLFWKSPVLRLQLLPLQRKSVRRNKIGCGFLSNLFTLFLSRRFACRRESAHCHVADFARLPCSVGPSILKRPCAQRL
jgi:hypothetical protein